MPVSIEVVLTLIGIVLTAGALGGGVVFAYGRLTQKADTHTKDLDALEAHHAKDMDEVFTRLRLLEGIAPALQDAVNKLDRILNNGVTITLQSISERLARVEQRCEDHYKDGNDKGRKD